MRILSVVPSVRAGGWLIYVIAGGPFEWPIYAIWALIVVLGSACIVASYKHVSGNQRLSDAEKIRWRTRFWYFSLVSVPWYWNSEARRQAAGRAPVS